MQAQPHLFKRGNVYHWRRRICRQSTGIFDFKLSLGTTELPVATILCRKISAESDIIMQEIFEHGITADEARKWLAEVIRKEKALIDRNGLFRRVLATDVQEEEASDERLRRAWAHIAKHGIHAPPPKDADNLLLMNLHGFREDLSSDVRRYQIGKEFAKLTGRDDVSALGKMTLLDLLIAGRSAAWNEDRSSSQLCQSLLEAGLDTAHAHGRPALSSLSNAESAAPAAHENSIAESETNTPHDPSIFAVAARMNAFKRAEGIEEKTLRQYESSATLFVRLTGIEDVRKIRQSHASAFRADLQKIPTSWGKSPVDRTASREEIMARAAKLPADKVGLSVGTLNRHLEHLKQIVEWADGEGIAIDSRLKPGKLRRKDKVRARDKKASFPTEQLRVLFRNPVRTGSESERYQTRPGRKIYRNGLYWAPLIGAATGARREEIAGLAPSDIIEADGIPCFSIEDSELRRVKNLSSRRILPIHPSLIELGFLDYVKGVRKSVHPDLVPSSREPKSGEHGRKLGRRMRQIIDETLGDEGKGLSFHSLRHFVQNALDRADVKDEIVRDIVGHEGKDIHDKVYRDATSPAKMLEALISLPVIFEKVDLTGMADEPYRCRRTKPTGSAPP